MGSRGSGENLNAVSQEEMKIYHALLLESNIQIDNEVLIVIANLLRLNVAPDVIYSMIKQIAPVCGLLKRFKLKPQKSHMDTK